MSEDITHLIAEIREVEKSAPAGEWITGREAETSVPRQLHAVAFDPALAIVSGVADREERWHAVALLIRKYRTAFALMVGELERLAKANDELAGILGDIVLMAESGGDLECAVDHRGNCQAHLWFGDGECPYAVAKRVLAGLGRR